MPETNSTPIVTRFAPSPTGYLHIGGARTALFNWLYARGRGGKFLLRIEDTDRARHNEAAVAAIIDGLSWLGLDWDSEPVSQYERRDRHVEIAQALLEKGAAYRCYMTADEIETARHAARETKTRFESPWRNHEGPEPADKTFTIRFKAPHDGETKVRDVVQGEVAFPNSALDDLILVRSDNAPTYNLAVVVDDHDMGVTHVVRGDDHLNNAARQQQIYEALDWAVPTFAHVPLIHGQDGAKLSKRHGALGVEAYRDDGFLAEALSNYLLRLGWSHGDDEIFSRDEAKKLFDITGINKAPARLDLDKLRHINAHYIARIADADLIDHAAPFMTDPSVCQSPETAAALRRAAPFLKTRMTTLRDINDAAAFILAAPPAEITGKAGKPLEKEGARTMLGEIGEMLSATSIWGDPTLLDDLLKAFAEDKGVGFGQIGPLLRAALTGGAPAPGLGEVLYSLGRDESLHRINAQKQ